MTVALKHTLTAEEYGELSEALQEHYAEDDDGGYKLDVEDSGEGDKVTKLNALLKKNQKESGELKDRLAAETKKLVDAQEEIDALKQSTGSQAELEVKVAKLAKQLEKREAALEEAAAKQQAIKFKEIARAAAAEAGVAARAMPDVLAHLSTIRGMKLVDDEVLADDGTTLDEVLTAMRKEQSYFFGESKGGGTPAGRPGKPKKLPEKTVGMDDLDDPEVRKALAEGKVQFVPDDNE